MSRTTCPKCGSSDIEYQTFQENRGGKTVTKTTSKYKEKGHGCLWWIFVGSWWWMVDIFLWIFFFLPRVLLHIGRKKNYKQTSTSVAKTKNKISYRTMGQCRSCGYKWNA